MARGVYLCGVGHRSRPPPLDQRAAPGAWVCPALACLRQPWEAGRQVPARRRRGTLAPRVCSVRRVGTTPSHRIRLRTPTHRARDSPTRPTPTNARLGTCGAADTQRPIARPHTHALCRPPAHPLHTSHVALMPKTFCCVCMGTACSSRARLHALPSAVGEVRAAVMTTHLPVRQPHSRARGAKGGVRRSAPARRRGNPDRAAAAASENNAAPFYA